MSLTCHFECNIMRKEKFYSTKSLINGTYSLRKSIDLYKTMKGRGFDGYFIS